MNKFGLIYCGGLPFIAGFLLDQLMANTEVSGWPLILISVLFFVCWFFYGYKAARSNYSKLQTFLYANAIPILMLIIILVQLTVSGGFWPSAWGFVPQLFFLPGVSLASLVVRAFSFGMTINMLVVFIIEFTIMCLTFREGYNFALKKKELEI